MSDLIDRVKLRAAIVEEYHHRPVLDAGAVTDLIDAAPRAATEPAAPLTVEALAEALETVGRWQGRVTSKDVWLDEARSVIRELAALASPDKGEPR